MNRNRASIRSRGSSSTGSHNRGKQIKDWCRKTIAFMCTQVGVGGLIVAYALIGAASFMSIETQEPNKFQYQIETVSNLRNNCANSLWVTTEKLNKFEIDIEKWRNESDVVLRAYQINLTAIIKEGYDGRTPKEKWSFPAALLFCLSVITMIGYGNMVPTTQMGKLSTVIYATFGIPIYVLYFLNMGKFLARTFRYFYTWLHQCTSDHDELLEEGEVRSRKKITVPSTACLWVISFYIFLGTVMFAIWEKWEYLDSAYFCVTSLCKIGFGDFVPGANFNDTESEKQTKLAINFVYMLFGMGIVAMCYNLMCEDVKVKMQELKEDMRLCMEDVRSRFARCFGDDQYYNY